MRFFSFDKYWGLDWSRADEDSVPIVTATQGDFIYMADIARSSKPSFTIYHKEVSRETCLARSLDMDMFIMQQIH